MTPRRANRIICPVCGHYLLRVDQLWVNDDNHVIGCTTCLPASTRDDDVNGRVLVR